VSDGAQHSGSGVIGGRLDPASEENAQAVRMREQPDVAVHRSAAR